MNAWTIAGYVGGEPELQVTPNGLAIFKFNVGVKGFKKGQETTSWVRCVAFDKLAERMEKLGIDKGWFMVCTGRAEATAYVNHKGEAVANLGLVVADFSFKAKAPREPDLPEGYDPFNPYIDDEVTADAK